MIEQTIPFPELTQGLARCVREWLLPHLEDPMARAQAELVATILDGLPTAYGDAVAAAIRADTQAARALLERLGGTGPAPSAPGASIDTLVRENSAVKVQLQSLADAARADGAADQLHELQRFFVASANAELRLAAGEGTDFASISAKDRAGKKG